MVGAGVGVAGLSECDASYELLDLVLAGGAVHVVLGALLGLDFVCNHHCKLAAKMDEEGKVTMLHRLGCQSAHITVPLCNLAVSQDYYERMQFGERALLMVEMMCMSLMPK